LDDDVVDEYEKKYPRTDKGLHMEIEDDGEASMWDGG
jgi:hypothetical protein